MTRLIVSLLLLGCVASTVRADPYWIAYEGNDFPENEGWTRLWNGPFAERCIEDGALVIDATEEPSTCDWYEMYPEITAPETVEEFVLQWRLKIEEFSGGWLAASIGVFADDCWAAAFQINNDPIRSGFETDVFAHFEADEYHEFEMRSPDMRSYELYIDGDYAFEGSLWQSVWEDKFVWGEGTTESSCLTRWDYVRFGAVPEPSTTLMFLVALFTRRVRQ